MRDAWLLYAPYWPFYAVVLAAFVAGVAYAAIDRRRHR